MPAACERISARCSCSRRSRRDRRRRQRAEPGRDAVDGLVAGRPAARRPPRARSIAATAVRADRAPARRPRATATTSSGAEPAGGQRHLHVIARGHRSEHRSKRPAPRRSDASDPGEGGASGGRDRLTRRDATSAEPVARVELAGGLTSETSSRSRVWASSPVKSPGPVPPAIRGARVTESRRRARRPSARRGASGHPRRGPSGPRAPCAAGAVPRRG